jgi:drug/metabolite transporter (DMT)-like permease
MVYIKLLLTMIFWGGTFVSGRMLAGHVAPFSAAFLRFAMAATILLMVLYRRNGRLPTVPGSLRAPILFLGITGVFSYNVLFFWGLQSVAASRASVIIANNPVFIALFAALIFRERLGWMKSLGVAVSLSGAVIAISRGDMTSLVSGGLCWGDLMIFGCVLNWVAFSLLGKVVVSRMPPLTVISYAATVGALLLFFPAVLEGMLSSLENYAWLDWANIAYLGIFGTAIGFVWYYEGIERIGATRAALFINFVPISGIILADVLLGEPITRSLLMGTTMVLSGVYLANNGLPYLSKRPLIRT